jgi:hypothetical protein
MAKPSPRPKAPARPRYTKGTRKGKVRKEFWLDPKMLRIAKEELGAATEQEAIDLALDLVTFRREVMRGIETLAGLDIAPIR